MAPKKHGKRPKDTTAEQIVWWPVGQLKANPRNSRVHPKEQLAVLKKAVAQYGQVWPILAEADGTIVARHGLFQAMVEDGIEEVKVLVVRDMTPEQIRAFIIADNQLGMGSEWDEKILSEELQILRELEEDILATLGFEEDELEKRLAGMAQTAPDDFPSFDENVPTEHCCPSCGYKWSGKANAQSQIQPESTEADGE